MCEWSENDRKYIVNELLRFGLTQSEEFQKYKTECEPRVSKTASDTKPVPPAIKSGPEPASKASSPMASATSRLQSTES